MELEGSVAVVTGGTGGLGQRIGLALASQGVHVAVVYQKSREAAEAWAEKLSGLGPRAVAIQADVTQPDQLQALVEGAVREFGRLDTLVNNAAFNQWIPYKDLDALTLEVWNQMLHHNLTSPFLAIKAVAPIMQRQQQGRIVNIASTAGLMPSGSSIAYAVSKAALIHLTRCMAVALAPHVLVNCVAPGLMDGTRMTDNLDPEYAERARRSSALGMAADKDDVANQVVTFVRSNSATGQTTVIDAGRFYH